MICSELVENFCPPSLLSWSSVPCQIKFQFCRVPRMGGIKLQLLCGATIELAIGSLPYHGIIRISGSVLDETGNYLDSQFVSPVWT